MFIVWGWGNWPETLSQGNFFCPGCRCDTAYDHRQMRTWGTIFFIPLIPLAAGQRYVECRQCKGTFIEEILNMSASPPVENAANPVNPSNSVATFRSATGPGDTNRYDADHGKRVLAQRGKYRYPGTVRGGAGKRVEVDFDDGECELVSSRHMAPLRFGPGDSVFARRDGNFEYEPAHVTAVNDSQLEVRFADGRQAWAKWADIRVVWQDSQNEGIAS